MADRNKRLPENVEGDLFVDSTCINCHNCSRMAPATFKDVGIYHVVYAQPTTEAEKLTALRALVCCPTGAIGTQEKASLKEIMQDFPLPIAEDLYYCGFNSPKSAGAASYFLRHPGGNWLICTPKFIPQLVSKFEAMGGVKFLFMSHRDDVGEAIKYGEKFGCQRIIHANDLDALPEAEMVLGDERSRIGSDFLVLPTPGHTEGHCMLLFKDRYLFSGDTFDPRPENYQLQIWSPLWTWYSFTEQTESVERLLDLTFEWILPSHGQRMKIAPQDAGALVATAVEQAHAVSDPDPATPEKLRNLEMYARELRKLNQGNYALKVEARAQAVRNRLSR